MKKTANIFRAGATMAAVALFAAPFGAAFAQSIYQGSGYNYITSGQNYVMPNYNSQYGQNYYQPRQQQQQYQNYQQLYWCGTYYSYSPCPTQYQYPKKYTYQYQPQYQPMNYYYPTQQMYYPQYYRPQPTYNNNYNANYNYNYNYLPTGQAGNGGMNYGWGW